MNSFDDTSAWPSFYKINKKEIKIEILLPEVASLTNLTRVQNLTSEDKLKLFLERNKKLQKISQYSKY